MGSPTNKFILLLKSRKFWAAFVGLILLIVKGFDESFPLDGEMTTQMIYLLVAYIMGTGIEDGLAAR